MIVVALQGEINYLKDRVAAQERDSLTGEVLTLNELRSKLENMHRKNAMMLRNKVKRESEADEVLRMQEAKIE